jgi:hypothetical protein
MVTHTITDTVTHTMTDVVTQTAEVTKARRTPMRGMRAGGLTPRAAVHSGVRARHDEDAHGRADADGH